MRGEDRGNNHSQHERDMSHMEWKNDTYRQARGGLCAVISSELRDLWHDVAILFRTHGDKELTQHTRCVR